MDGDDTGDDNVEALFRKVDSSSTFLDLIIRTNLKFENENAHCG